MRVTLSLVIVCAAVFILQNIIPGVTGMLSLTPVDAFSGSWWQFITYMFAHYDYIHIIFNMFGLIIFGPIVEKAMGWDKYLALFLLCGLGSALFHIALTGEATTMLLGASGAVFGILAAYGILYPKNWIFVFGIPMPAIVAVAAFIVIEFTFGMTGAEAGVANFGHLGGIVTSIAFMGAYKLLSRKKENKVKLGEFEWIWE